MGRGTINLICQKNCDFSGSEERIVLKPIGRESPMTVTVKGNEQQSLP